MLNSIVVLIGPAFNGDFGQKNHNCLFMVKVITYTNSNMLNLIVTFICPALDMKSFFEGDLMKKMKVVCLG